MPATWEYDTQQSLFSQEDIEAMERGIAVEASAALRTGGTSLASGGAIRASQPPKRRVNPKRRTEDFGERIGGARKDLWRAHGLSPADMEGMTPEERAHLATKANVWPTPKYQELHDAGASRVHLWWEKRVRDALPTRPRRQSLEEDYVRLVSGARDAVRDAIAAGDISGMGDWLERAGYIERSGGFGSSTWSGRYLLTVSGELSGVDNRLLRAFTSCRSEDRLRREADGREFLFTDREKALHGWRFGTFDAQSDHLEHLGGRLYVNHGGMIRRLVLSPTADEDGHPREADFADGCTYAVSPAGTICQVADTRQACEELVVSRWLQNRAEAREDQRKRRKGKLKPPQLEHCERYGPKTGRPEHVVGQDFLDDYGIRGGQFGNWMSEQDRRFSLDMAWDAFHDMAVAWGIDDHDMSMGGKLGMAWGARGRTAALAHYEPYQKVINLTKMKGAGSLAHEMVHAFDDILGQDVGIGGCARKLNRSRLPEELRDLYDAMRVETLTGQDAVDRYQQEYDQRVRKYRADLDKITMRSDDPGLEARRKECVDALVRETCEAEPTDSLGITCRTPAWNALLAQQREAYERAGIPSRRTTMESASSLAWAQRERATIPEMAAKLGDAAAIGTLVRDTQFYSDAKAIDGSYTKAGHGYWSSDCEMLARAGAVITYDRLNALGIRDDYLVGHAPGQTVLTAHGTASTVPHGAERERIAKAMDRCVDALKRRGLLHDRPGQERHEHFTAVLDEDLVRAPEAEAASRQPPARHR